MKRLCTIAVLSCVVLYQGHLSSQGRAGIFQEYVVNAEDLTGLLAAARAVQFRETRLRGMGSRRGDLFEFVPEGGYSKVLFRSRGLARLCDRLNNAQQFAGFVARATVFGVAGRDNALEAELFLSSVCHDANCADEDFVLIRAD